MFLNECWKFGFVGERESGLQRPRTFLKKGSWISKNFQKTLKNNPFLKVLEGSPEGNFFQEVSLWRSPRSPTNCNLLFTSQMYLLLFYHKSHEKASADLKNGQETGEREQKYLPKIHLQNRAYFTKIRRHTNYLQSRAGNPLTT
jgi:hypothetical protein